MKSVPCQNPNCSARRIHHEEPDVLRAHQNVYVPDDFDLENNWVFCSITCAAEAKAFNIKTGEWKKKNEE